MTSHGQGPYFQQLTVDDVILSKCFYTLRCDETGSNQSEKQLDVLGWQKKNFFRHGNEQNNTFLKIKPLEKLPSFSIMTGRPVPWCILQLE